MDFFQHRYYRLNKTLMTIIGQWPYQSTLSRRVTLAVLIFLGTGQVAPQILALVKHRDDWRTLLDCVVPLLFEAVCATKLIVFVCSSRKTLKLLNRIRTDWQVWARDREVNVLHEYAAQGENISIVYTDLSILRTAVMYLSLFVFMTQPVVPKIVDVLLKNGTEPGKFPYPVDYYHLDLQKYYCYIIVYSYVCVCVTDTVSIASDVMLIVYAHHVCGIFAALGRKLERTGNNETSVEKGESPYEPDKRDMVRLASCIDRHNDAIEYVGLIDATYTWNFFFIIGIGAILFIATALQIFMTTNDPEVTTRFVVLQSAIILLFYVECYISEILMDHSISIGFSVYNSQWYRLSLKAQKLLQLMTVRCSVPCQLTAGKMFVMSVRTFWLTIKTTVSYFTVVRSMQGV